MNEHDTILFRIRTFPLIQYLIRIICLCWIVFAINKYDLNPGFFSITIVVACILIFVLYNRTITVKKDFFEITRSCWIPLLNNSKRYNYTEIFDINFIKWNTSEYSLSSYYYKYFGYEMSKLHFRVLIETTEHSFIYLIPVGSIEEIEEFIKIVKQQIK